MTMKRTLLARITAGLAAACFASAVSLGVAMAAGAPSGHHAYCAKPLRLRHPESLRQLSRQFPWTPAEILSQATSCWGYHGPRWDGWTPNLSRLLDGQYGKDILRIKLPAGTRIWLP